MTDESSGAMPAPIVVPVRQDALDELLDKEWLLANRIGAYASSTAVGCNSRRYHGLLVASTMPPVGRVSVLSTVMEQVALGGQTYELASNEFAGAFSPRGFVHLAEFRNDVAPTFIYRLGPATLTKEIMLAEAANSVAVRYTLRGASAKMALWPFVALRDFHGLRKVHEPHQITYQAVPDGASVCDRKTKMHELYMVSKDAVFEAKPQWWYKFFYRADIARGQDGQEDLYTPGFFTFDLADGRPVQFTASLEEPLPLGFESTTTRRRSRLAELAHSIGPSADETARRLAVASDAFVVERHFPGEPPSATILAGYHWFADWGRDSFIALPGLLLATGRMEQARQVFRTFGRYIQDGMVPNRFDDYSTVAHYNSIDASLWFIIACERYLEASGGAAFWRDTLLPACETILRHYHDGTRFDIRADHDALLTGGNYQTQLTWMDAKLGQEAITPRQGKAVEVNALWHSAHAILARRLRGMDDKRAAHYHERAAVIAASFVKVFWNNHAGCLYDCVAEGGPDGSIRPNQVLAVSLPESPLSRQQQASVLRVVEEKLLTPLGLRSLSPDDGRYRRRYGGSWESRDRSYHQGTVWAWLIGPFVEAFLKVNDFSQFALERARQLLGAFEGHLRQAGLGSISEIFDGDAPHAPRGCIAQAWSVGEVLRIKLLIEKHAK